MAFFELEQCYEEIERRRVDERVVKLYPELAGGEREQSASEACSLGPCRLRSGSKGKC